MKLKNAQRPPNWCLIVPITGMHGEYTSMKINKIIAVNGLKAGSFCNAWISPSGVGLSSEYKIPRVDMNISFAPNAPSNPVTILQSKPIGLNIGSIAMLICPAYDAWIVGRTLFVWGKLNNIHIIIENGKIIFPAFVMKLFNGPQIEIHKVFSFGILYSGRIEGAVEIVPFIDLFSKSPVKKANIVPKMYNPNKIVPLHCSSKKAAINNVKTGSVALQLKNGIIIVVIIFSLLVRRVLVAIMAGTLQPYPMINGIIDSPLSPTIFSVDLKR